MKHYISIFILALLAASCEKPIFDEERATGGSVADTHPNVTLHFSPYEQQAFTRAATPLTDQCTRLSIAVFTADGTKAKAITQKQTDAGFGTAALTLQAGTYRVVAIAHSSTEGNATITSPEKVTFANNKLTDTFYYFGTLTVLDGSPIEETLEMTRCVAMLRLTLTEPLSDNITRLKFYYTGGSSTFSPATGYGCVNSKQTEYRYTTDDQDMPVSVYELYTMPHEQQDVLKLTVTALDASGSEVGEVIMDNIPVTRNKITTWQGALFGSGTGGEGGTSSSGGISITLDTEWDGTITYTF